MRRLAPLVFLTAAACGPEVPSETPRTKAAPSTSALAGVGSSMPGVSAVGPSASPSSSAPDEERVQPSRTALGGSTRGAVVCGTHRCSTPSEGCYWDPEAFDWRCQSPDAPLPEGPDVGTAFFACDDASDCPADHACCNPWGEHFSGTTRCIPRAEAGMCASELCMDPKVTDGAGCPAGTTCEGATSTDAGSCVAPKGPATCGGRQKCPASKPICVMASTGPTCVASGSPAWAAVPGRLRFQCTLQSDCHAGDTCAYVFGEIDHPFETYCGKWNPAYMGSLACEVGKQEPCVDAECRAKMMCHPRSEGPAWLGVWGSK